MKDYKKLKEYKEAAEKENVHTRSFAPLRSTGCLRNGSETQCRTFRGLETANPATCIELEAQIVMEKERERV
jgi:hypothetical protein